MLSTTDILLIIAIFFIGVVMTKKQEIIIMKDSDGPVTQEINVSGGSGDDRYKRAPRPQRFWQVEQEIPTRGALGPTGSRFTEPIPTRGAPESYQQMGVVLGSDGKPLPLYGRRVAPRSDRFNYYTRTDTYNPVALPVTFKNKNCQDNLGCHQVFNGDSIQISPTGEEVKVTLYGFDGPRYTPDIA
jgi:hypothetical protein